MIKYSEKELGRWYALINAWQCPSVFKGKPMNNDELKGALRVLSVILPEKVKREAWQEYINQEPSDD